MAFTWQDVATLALVGLAAAYLVRAAWRQIRSRSSAGCGSGGCGACPSAGKATPGASDKAPEPVVTIGGSRAGQPRA